MPNRHLHTHSFASHEKSLCRKLVSHYLVNNYIIITIAHFGATATHQHIADKFAYSIHFWIDFPCSSRLSLISWLSQMKTRSDQPLSLDPWSITYSVHTWTFLMCRRAALRSPAYWITIFWYFCYDFVRAKGVRSERFVLRCFFSSLCRFRFHSFLIFWVFVLLLLLLVGHGRTNYVGFCCLFTASSAIMINGDWNVRLMVMSEDENELARIWF